MVEAVVNYVYSLADEDEATHPAIWMGLLGEGTNEAALEAIGIERRDQRNVQIRSIEFSRVRVG